MSLAKSTTDSLLKIDSDHKCDDKNNCLKIEAVAKLPTIFGKFDIVAFAHASDGKEHVALLHGDIFDKENVPVRVHSECLTGESFGSLRCDCRDQIELAMKEIVKFGGGAVLYLRQEGRGIGLMNKIRAYQLEDEGYDTYQANEMLGFKDDERDYKIAAHMLKSLQVRSIKLMTNNPLKVEDLKRHGVVVTQHLPIIIPPNKYDKDYLSIKMRRSGHALDDIITYEE